MTYSANINGRPLLGINAVNVLLEGTQFAAQSLSTFIDCNVELTNFSVTNTGGLEVFKSAEENKVILLKTELMGELGGINYFLLPIDHVMKICSKKFSDTDAKSKPMMIEFLKEMENILAAAAITNIANQLEINIFGDVPKAQAIQYNKVLDTIESEALGLPPKLVVSCEFNIPEIDISANYMWVFSEAMLLELQLMYN